MAGPANFAVLDEYPLPAQVRVEELPGRGVRYCFPRRPQKVVRWGGPIILIIMLGSMIGAILAGHVVAPIFELSFLLIGARLAFGWSEVVFQDGVVTNREHVGPLFRTRKTRIDEVDELSVRRYPNVETRGDSFAVWAARTALAPCYPRQWCNALATDLGLRTGVAARTDRDPDDQADEDDSAVDAVANAADFVAAASARRPVKSKITLDERAEALTISIPPLGIRRGSKGLIWGAAGVFAFLGVCLVFVVTGAAQKPGITDVASFLAITSLFWLIGLAMLIASINMGVRRGAIAISSGRLLIIQTGIFGKKQQEWDGAQIDQVQAGTNGTKINDRELFELQVLTHDKKRTGFFSSLSNEELQWLAQTIKAALKSL